jgi:type IV pilus assembly protein PilW
MDMKHHGLQTGLSLVELMVALAISSFLILGVTQIYIDNKRSYAFQQNQAENLEGGRYALLLLQQELSKAGYRRRPDELPEQAFPATTAADCTFGEGAAVAWKQRSSSAANVEDRKDSLCIRYQPRDEQDRDCLGNQIATKVEIPDPYTSAPKIAVVRFYLKDDGLNCKVRYTDISGAPVGSSDQTGELIGGVVDLRYELGVGSSSDARSVSGYTAGAPTTAVLTVRYTALLRSSNAGLRDSANATDALKNWQSLTGVADSDTLLASLKQADKGQLYQVSQSTVMLRNLMP